MLDKIKFFNRPQKLYTVTQRINRIRKIVYSLLIVLGVSIASFIIVFISEFNRVSTYYFKQISESRIDNSGTQRKNFVNQYFSMAFHDLNDFHQELVIIDISDGAGNVDLNKLYDALDDSEIMPYFLENVGVLYNDKAIFSKTSQ